MKRIRVCATCKRSCKSSAKPLAWLSSKYCSYQCKLAKAPGVYRFVCPDGRSYVGSRLDVTKRERDGIRPQNRWLAKALKKYPPATFRFEILQRLKPGCPTAELRAAEQHWLDHFCSWRESDGFNMFPAVWHGNGPAQQAARRRRKKINRAIRARGRRATTENHVGLRT